MSEASRRFPVGRFAPSPTGPLHFGTLVAAVGSYCLARQGGGQWLLRIEDLDTPRVVAGAAEEMLASLEGLGFEWDGEVVYQSRRRNRYAEVLEELRRRGLVFDCGCSRREILASAPHPGEEGPVYPGTCRHGLAPGRQPRSRRLRVAGGSICYVDGVFGAREQHLHTEVGDFILQRADGFFAYQLAVVVDDLDSGITQVVRGADLLGSTPRQIYLYQCLGAAPPNYIHLPLALASSGQKLSKRNIVPGGDAPLDGRALAAALTFLGQPPPAALVTAPAAELLAWGCRNFQLERVGRQPRPAPGESFSPAG